MTNSEILTILLQRTGQDPEPIYSITMQDVLSSSQRKTAVATSVLIPKSSWLRYWKRKCLQRKRGKRIQKWRVDHGDNTICCLHGTLDQVQQRSMVALLVPHHGIGSSVGLQFWRHRSCCFDVAFTGTERFVRGMQKSWLKHPPLALVVYRTDLKASFGSFPLQNTL